VDVKSVSVEETYEHDLVGTEVVETALLAHAQRLSGRLRRAGLRARTVTLKVKYPDFTLATRSQTLAVAVDGSRQIYQAALELARGLAAGERPVRLLGLGGGSLEPVGTPAQLEIGREIEWDKVEDAVAEVRQKFGDRAVGPARLLTGEGGAGSGEEP
jgi:DNA polymerase-4